MTGMRAVRMLARIAFLAWIAFLVCCAAPAPSLVQETTSASGRKGDAFADLTTDGAWCWFADPRAVYHADRRRQTFVGWVTRTGHVQVAAFDHAQQTHATTTLHRGLDRDDHANPALLIRPDGRLMAFYSAHSRKGVPMRVRTTRRPEDITAWEPARPITSNTTGNRSFCYPNPIQLAAENHRIYLFWRGGNWKPTYAVSDDGVTWSPARTFITGRNGNLGNRPYCKFASNGRDRFDVAFTTGHPRNEPANSIYYVSYRRGTLCGADGTPIKKLADGPVTFDESDLVHDAKARGARAWIWDIAIEPKTGFPVIVFSTHPTEEDHRYRYARWDGKRWLDHEIGKAGGWFPQTPEGKREPEPHYSGGIVLDHADPRVVYLSRPTGGVFEIERGLTADHGRTWTFTAVTRGSKKHNVRPVRARGAPANEPALLWMRGDYTHYLKFRTAIKFAVDRKVVESAALAGQARAIRAVHVDEKVTRTAIRSVCDWQLRELRDGEAWRGSRGWVRGAFLTGLMAAWRATKEENFLEAAVGLSAVNAWKLGKRPRHADDHCVGQTYAELHAIEPETARLTALRAGFDHLLANPRPGRVDWWWCDALFMAPPALARLAAATGERRYLDFMDRMWWDATAFLYDEKERLCYRDKRFFEAREPNGQPVFWSRGNGWVLAGLARVLQFLPTDYPTRPKYEALFRQMAARIVEIRPRGTDAGPTGLWRASLLDPDSRALGETSGSGFFCFALAWGVNAGLLDRERYRPIVLETWRALLGCVHPDGKLGYVQQIGDRPADISADDTQEYGVGAFLLAGEQVLKLL